MLTTRLRFAYRYHHEPILNKFVRDLKYSARPSYAGYSKKMLKLIFMKKKTEPKPRILEVIFSDEKEVRVTLPLGARITFGPAIPGKKNGNFGDNGQHGYSLRVYETKNNDSLVAVFCDVRCFRDIEIPVDKLILHREGKTAWESGSDGSMKVTQETKVTRTFEEEVQLLTSGKK